VGVAARLAAQRLAFLGVGLFARDAGPLGSADHLVSGDLQQPAVHRVGDGLGLHGAVDDDALEIGGAHGPDVDRAFDGGLEQLLQAVLTQQAPKAADLGGVARQARLVVVIATEELPLHVLGPTLDQLFVAEVEAVLQVQQADHQAHWQAWAAGRADATAEFAVECASQIFADQTLSRLRLMGQLGCHRRLDRGPRQPCGQHRQRVLQIDHLVQARAKKVRRAHPQIPQKSGHRNIVLRGIDMQDSRRKASFHAGCSHIAGPTMNACAEVAAPSTRMQEQAGLPRKQLKDPPA